MMILSTYAEGLKQVFENHLLVAERGEQWFLDVGRLAAGILTPAGRIADFIDELAGLLIKRRFDTVKIEASSYAMNMTAARALGAVYSPALCSTKTYWIWLLTCKPDPGDKFRLFR